MNFKKWNEIFKEISLDLKINPENDKKASYIFNNILINRGNKNNIFKLNNLIKNKEIIIFGAGPSLKKSIIKYKNFIKNRVKISADGATSALIENNINPDIIVTDLDGKIRDQIYANSNGSIIVIHSHGDNIKRIKKNIEKFKSEIIGTTQIDPTEYPLLNNFGGFTDGDRSVLLAIYFKAKFIYLIGFDFNGEIGEYSFTNNSKYDIKINKLKWCKIIIDNVFDGKKMKYL
jgi:uncharacterized Rossmann fold enzyme